MNTLQAVAPFKILHKTDFMEIWLDGPISLLVLRWKRQISFEERVAGYEQVFAYLKQYAIRNLVVDNEAIFLFSATEKEWITATFSQWILEAKLQRFGLVTTDLYKNLLDLSEFIGDLMLTDRFLGQVEHEFFVDHYTARQWVLDGESPLLN